MDSHEEEEIASEELPGEDEEEEMDLDSEEEEEEDEADGSASDSEGPRRRSKKFVIPPRRALPSRTTRGKRIGSLQGVQDEEADEEFWNQEFFAEEDADERYETESEPEDRFDADFNESEEEEEDEETAEMAAEEEAKALEPKKKVLKPPGYKRLAPNRKQAASPGGSEEARKAAKKSARTSTEPFIPPERTISVRESTRQRVQEAEEERKLQEALKPKRVSRPVVHRQLTQAELLAEAARTEIENTRSLQYLVMVEEATRKKAEVKRARYVGPMIRIRSGKRKMPVSSKDDEGVATDGVENEYVEVTTLEVQNMQMPSWLQSQRAPPPRQRPLCVITGKPARYRDPVTGLPYYDSEAYKELKARRLPSMRERIR